MAGNLGRRGETGCKATWQRNHVWFQSLLVTAMIMFRIIGAGPGVIRSGAKPLPDDRRIPRRSLSFAQAGLSYR